MRTPLSKTIMKVQNEKNTPLYWSQENEFFYVRITYSTYIRWMWEESNKNLDFIPSRILHEQYSTLFPLYELMECGEFQTKEEEAEFFCKSVNILLKQPSDCELREIILLQYKTLTERYKEKYKIETYNEKIAKLIKSYLNGNNL